jgi:hypothetical protein
MKSDLSDNDLYRYPRYYENLRSNVLLDLWDPSEAIQEQGKDPKTLRDSNTEIHYFEMCYGVPEFRFRRVEQGISAEAIHSKHSFHNPAVTIKACGIDQVVLDRLILSYHVRALLGRIATVVENRNKAEQDKRLAAMDSNARALYEKQRRKRREKASKARKQRLRAENTGISRHGVRT